MTVKSTPAPRNNFEVHIVTRGGGSVTKVTEMLIGYLKETPKRDQDLVESTVINFAPYLYPKRYRKSHNLGPFETEHPKRYQNRIFNP